MPIPIIDLFAGPGGLGEGFSSLTAENNEPIFKIKLSIEMDEQAHRTLELRAFFRQFPRQNVPKDYYDYLAGRISRSELLGRHPDQARQAAVEAWQAELGATSTPDDEVDGRIRTALDGQTNWVLIGGPPCQAYSLVGRSRMSSADSKKDKERKEKHENDHRHFLYREYLRILAVYRPPVFVMENVKGLLSAEVKKQRMFERILSDLAEPLSVITEARQSEQDVLTYHLMPVVKALPDSLGKYLPEGFVVRAEEYGIPQARHRVIILGIRSDLVVRPRQLITAPMVSIEQVIDDLPRLRSGLSKEQDSAKAWRDAIKALAGAKWLTKGKTSSQLSKAINGALRDIGASLGRGGEFLPNRTIPSQYAEWYGDPRLEGVCNHGTRAHIRTDLHRYFFAAVFAHLYKRSPLLGDLPKALLPHHENVKAALEENKFNDRFRVQLRGRPSTTVVSHISKDGHYYIHYDPSQCRSLTVREAARLQTFPDNYFFEGPRTEQYKQVGNAVPPLLARKIAEIVAELIQQV